MLYRPRVAADLDVPVLGTREQRIQQEKSDEVIRVPMPVRSAKWDSNDFNHADTCSLTVDWNDTALDPRMLDDAVLRLYIGEADDYGRFQPSAANCRFIGHLRNPERSNDSDGPSLLTLDAIDYTGLFLLAKPFGSSGIPEYSLNLEQAWRKICSQVPGADILADRLLLIGLETPPLLSTAVASRFANLGKVPTHPKTDAWAVWQQCVGMLGLISWIDKDYCIVSTATNYYTEQNPPRLIWGKNIRKLSEGRQTIQAGSGIGVTSFDPIAGKTIEALWPPEGDSRVQKKRIKATKKSQTAAAERDNEKREYFEYWGVTDPDVLLKIAERIYEERSRQEFAGEATTHEMRVGRADGSNFDLLLLKAGDSIRVEFDEGGRHFLSTLPNDGARVRYLTNRGYDPSIALLLARNISTFNNFSPTFYTTRVQTEIEEDEDSISFSVTVNYVNRIQIDDANTGLTNGAGP